jgi:hypothetical protein
MVRWRRGPRATWEAPDERLLAEAPAGGGGGDPAMRILAMGPEDGDRVERLPIPGGAVSQAAVSPAAVSPAAVSPAVSAAVPREGLRRDDLSGLFDGLEAPAPSRGASVRTLRAPKPAPVAADDLLTDDLGALLDLLPEGALPAPETVPLTAPVGPSAAAGDSLNQALLEKAAEEDCDVIVYGWGESADAVGAPAPERTPAPALEADVELLPDDELEFIRQSIQELVSQDLFEDGMGDDAGGHPMEMEEIDDDSEEEPGAGYEVEIIDYEASGGNPIDDESDWGALEFQSHAQVADPTAGRLMGSWADTHTRHETVAVQLPAAGEARDAAEGAAEEGDVRRVVPELVELDELEPLELAIPLLPEDALMGDEGDGPLEISADLLEPVAAEPAHPEKASAHVMSRQLALYSFEEHLAALEGPALDPVHLYLRSAFSTKDQPDHHGVFAAILKARCDYQYWRPLVPEGVEGRFRGYYADFHECLRLLGDYLPPREDRALNAEWDEAWNLIEGGLPRSERGRRVA